MMRVGKLFGQKRGGSDKYKMGIETEECESNFEIDGTKREL